MHRRWDHGATVSCLPPRRSRRRRREKDAAMPHCRLGIVFWLLVVLLYSPGRAGAGDLFGWKKQTAAAVPQAPYNPPRAVAGAPPGHTGIPQSEAATVPGTATASACPRTTGAISGPRITRPASRTTAITAITRSGRGGRGTEFVAQAGWAERSESHRREARNPKHEIRNKSKAQNSNPQHAGFLSFGFRILNLFQISSFGFWI